MTPMRFLLFLVATVAAHSRFACPTPRSSDPGIKNGPCGNQTNDFTGPIMVIAPGPMTIVWEEAVFHHGAPWRFSLSNLDNDTVACVLLDHVPHNDYPANIPNISDNSTYVKYYITLIIPDVKCARCALQLANPMTDKIPNGTYCTDPYGSCASVYHSCANVQITGSGSFDSLTCSQPDAWPRASLQAGNYTQEPEIWTDGWLKGYPSSVNTATGPCVEDSSDSSDDNLVIIVTVSVVGGLALVAIVAFICYRRRKQDAEAFTALAS